MPIWPSIPARRLLGWCVLVLFGLGLPALAGSAQKGVRALALAGLTFTSTGGEAADFTLWADRAYLDARAEQVWLEQVNLTIHSDPDWPAVELRCSEGYFELKSEAFRLAGNVRGHLGPDRRFQAEWVAYDKKRGVLYSDAPVVVEEEGSIYRGGGFRYRVAEGQLDLVDGVQVLKE